MDCIKIIPNKLEGTIRCPGSKSLTHRAIIGAGLANGVSKIYNVVFSDDILATIKAIEKMGAIVSIFDDYIIVDGSHSLDNRQYTIDCNESGSTLRFIVPISISRHSEVQFVGKGLLGSRPMKPYFDIFDNQNIQYSYSDECLDLKIAGQLKAGEFKLPGNVSSQFISGLLFALPLLEGNSVIEISSPLQSIDYVNMTIHILRLYGIEIQYMDGKYYISGNQKYKPFDYVVEGDYSQCAFFSIAASLNNNVSVSGMNESSLQGDKKLLLILEKMGVNYRFIDQTISFDSTVLRSVDVDCSDMPDVVPVLSLLCCVTKGKSVLRGLERLKYKECDRLFASYDILRKLGANIEIENDCLIIDGVDSLRGGVSVWGYDDHRIVMTLAIASCVCKEPIVIEGYQAVSKSYPSFFEDFKKLKGEIYGCNVEK